MTGGTEQLRTTFPLCCTMSSLACIYDTLWTVLKGVTHRVLHVTLPREKQHANEYNSSSYLSRTCTRASMPILAEVQLKAFIIPFLWIVSLSCLFQCFQVYHKEVYHRSPGLLDLYVNGIPSAISRFSTYLHVYADDTNF